ncbi:MAG: TonB-dependent receptor [Candidatus Eremiobacteraeota bacterium]|nr:TonB-dependent receptor [Candidatus Eremiobacteraeota bacterium]
MAPSVAQPVQVAQNATAATVSGVATDNTGAPLANATLHFHGPSDYTATTDAQGAYHIDAIAPGIYTVTAAKNGFNPATESDFAVVAGQANTLNVQLQVATLTTLQTIGHVSTSTRRSAFNATTASVQNISNQVFQDQGEQQVAHVLDQTPGIIIDHPGTSATNASPGAITFPSIRGGLGFETSSLIDGHPLAVGNFGDYVTTFLNGDLFSNVELVKGPGATLPEINYAINGAVNFRTLDPPAHASGQVKYGVDSFNGTFSNFRYGNTILNGKLGFIFDYAIVGTMGPLNNQPGITNISSSALINGQVQAGGTTSGSAIPGIQNSASFQNATALACCLNVPQTYTNKDELVKFKYNVSPATTVTASYLGSQTYTDQNGNHVYGFTENFAPGPAYTAPAGGLVPGPVQTFQNIFYPYTEYEINNEPILQAEIRTSFHNDNILARYYTASINRLQYNGLQNPADSVTIPLVLSGTVNLCPVGQVVGTGANAGKCGVPGGTFTAPTPTAFNGQLANVTLSPSGGVCGGPSTGWIASGVKNSAGIACGAPGNPFTGYTSPTYFRSEEADSLHGSSFEWDHPVGTEGDMVTLGFDQTNSRTTARDYPNAPTVPGVPVGSYEIYRTFLQRVTLQLGSRLNVMLANYLNLYDFHATPNGGIPVIGGTTNVMNPNPTFFDAKISHDDPRIGLTYRANRDTSIRFSAGSAIAPPYLNFLSKANTTPSANNPSAPSFYTNTISNTGVRPETAFEYDLGGDYRFPDGLTVVTGDLYLSNLQNQFFTAVIPNGCYNGTTATSSAANPDGTCPAGFLPLLSSQNRNLGHARYEGLELAFTRDPLVGIGFKVQGSLQRAYPYDIPPCFYATNSTCSNFGTNLAILPNENFVGSGTSGVPGSFNAINNDAIPYAQGYAELHYRTPNGGYLAVGEQYYGNNNSLNVPAFVTTAFQSTLPIGGKVSGVQLRFDVDNVFNVYQNAYITEYGGVAYPLINGNVGVTNANVIGPRNLKISLTKNF